MQVYSARMKEKETHPLESTQAELGTIELEPQMEQPRTTNTYSI